MEKHQAKDLIEKTFNTKFNKEQYTKFAINLLDGLNTEKSFTIQNIHVKESFKNYIESYGRIGKYIDSQGNDIEILWVNLKKETALDKARTMQRNFIAWYLNGGRGSEIRHNALVAFYNDELPDWRFSFVKLETDLAENDKGQLKLINNFTSAKRYSFLVGEQEPNHTAQSRLISILSKENPILSDIEEAFNIEKVSKEFFATYKELFLQLVDNLKEIRSKDSRINFEFETRNITEANFCKKLLGQLVFLYFIQKKGWLGVPKNESWGNGDKRFLRNTFKKAVSEGKNFFNDYLEPLFYNALANGERDFNMFELLDCKIPFLNGGLFEPIGANSGYDWVNTDIIFDNAIFSNNIEKNGDVGTGILDVFDRYNFTVKEDEPLEKEVAVDPEMLGKVFEELLEVEDRKSKGAFYTPREIVHYMCQESLINYLCTELNAVDDAFVKSETKQIELIEPEVKQLDFENKITKQAIADFVHHADKIAQNEVIAKVKEKSGDLGKTYNYHLDQSIRVNAKEIDKALENIKICDPAIGSGAFPVGMMNEIIRIRMALVEAGYLNQTKNRTPYDYKRQAIQNSIYGVDIDCGAIEIAKLRLWLSLVVDEDDIENIKPLPNLDYKIVCGNSLLGVEKNLFNQFYFEKLEELKPQYFNSTQKSEKRRLKKEIDEIIKELTKGGSFDFEIYFSEVFHDKGGFDVVIGNPPYVRVQNLSYDDIDKYKKLWTVAWKRIDISILFFELANKLLNEKGINSYISSNQFIVAEYGRKIREYLIKNAGLIKILDFGDLPVFENALTYVSVFFVSKQIKDMFLYHKFNSFQENYNLTKFEHIETKQLSDNSWALGTEMSTTIINKISSYDKLSNYAKSWTGVITGKDEVLMFDINDPFLTSIEKEILMPVLRAQNCQRYCFSKPHKVIIYPYKDIDGRTVLISEEEFKTDYPKTYNYLLENKHKLEQRKDSRKCVADNKTWYGLIRFGNLATFKKTKLISPGEVKNNKFGIDITGATYSCARVIAVVPENINSNYLLGILNSKLIEFYLHKNSALKQGGYYSYSSTVLDNLPVKIDLNNNQIANMVTEILKITQIEGYEQNQVKQEIVKECEKQIDLMVYKLYELNYSEVLIIDPDFAMPEEDYNNYSLAITDEVSI